MRREFWNKVLNIISGALVITGLLLLFGAAGELDMCEEMGEYLPLMATVKKVAIGLPMFAIGMMILNNKEGE